MRSLQAVSACLFSLVLVGVDASAQTVSQERVIINGAPGGEGPLQMPGMMPGRQFKAGTARIRGRIVSSDTGAPVRRAQVRVTGPEIAAKTAMTDAEGRYEFKDLPAGRYSVSVSKAGYVQVQFGQLRPFESGKLIELADAQLLDRADISMPRGSVVAGRILDEFGDPVADAVVSAMRSSWSNGRRRLQATGRTAQTNDLGQYRIYGLPPGDYYISATLRSGFGAEMAALEMAFAASAAAGAGAGNAGFVGAPSGVSPTSGYAPTYFPGTTSGSDAQKLTIAVGQEAQGTDFALLPVRLAKITGTVIGSDGKPAEGQMVNATPRVLDNAGLIIPSTARTDKNGNFTLNSLAPGDYNLQTRGMQIVTSSGGGDTMVFSARVTMGGPDGGEAEFGSVPVSVSGEDVNSVVIVTSKGATAMGHLTFEGGNKPANATQVRIIATSTDGDGGGAMMMGPGGMGTVKEDGSFELKGLAGTRLLRAVGLPSGWMLKAVRVNGAEFTDTGVEFKPGEVVTGLEIVATQKTTEVTGTVKTAGGELVKNFTLVVFSDQPELWTVPSGRHVTGIRPDQEGRFQLKNMPPGGYFAAAVEYIPQGEWGDPDVLERLKTQATRFSLTEGGTKSLDLKLQQ